MHREPQHHAERALGGSAVVGMVAERVDAAQPVDVGGEDSLAQHVLVEVELVLHERREVLQHREILFHGTWPVLPLLVGLAALQFEPTRLQQVQIDAARNVFPRPVRDPQIRLLHTSRTQQIFHVLRVEEPIPAVQTASRANRGCRAF